MKDQDEKIKEKVIEIVISDFVYYKKVQCDETLG